MINCTCPSTCASLNGSLVRSILCHICFNNIEATRLVCDISRRLLEDRKADEFISALESLLALLLLNDDHVAERTNLVMDSLVSGIVLNLKYEKESTVIINGLSSVLRTRTKGRNGTIPEVSLHTWIMDSLESDVSEWFKRPNTIAEVRQSIIGLIKSVLPLDDDSPSSECQQSLNSLQQANGNGYVHQKNKGNGPKHILNTRSDTRLSVVSSTLGHNTVKTKLDSHAFSSEIKSDDDVVVLGVISSSGVKKEKHLIREETVVNTTTTLPSRNHHHNTTRTRRLCPYICNKSSTIILPITTRPAHPPTTAS